MSAPTALRTARPRTSAPRPAPARTVLVGIDGPVAAGKTSLARALAARLPAVVVPEYPPHPDDAVGGRLPESAAGRWRVQRHYLAAEAQRRRLLAASGDAGWAVLDRSIASQAAHVAALRRVGGPDLRGPLAAWLRGRPVVEPDVLVVLDDPAGVDRVRLAGREAGPGRQGTGALFSEPPYVHECAAFLRRIAVRLPGRVVVERCCPDAEGVVRRILSVAAAEDAAASGLVRVLIEELDAG